MIFDSKTMFNARTDSVDVPMAMVGTDTTIVFTDIVDLKGEQTAQGKQNVVGVKIVAAPSAGTSQQFSITHCDTVGGSYTQCGVSKVYPIAELKAGLEIKIPVSETLLEFVKCSTINVGAIADSTALAGMVI